MTNRAEVMRQEIIRSGSPLAKHSLSQERIKREIDTRNKLLGKPNSKGEKVRASKRRTEVFIEQLPRRQFDRAFGHWYDGQATLEELFLIAKRIDDYGQAVRIDSKCEMMIVDLTKVGRNGNGDHSGLVLPPNGDIFTPLYSD